MNAWQSGLSVSSTSTDVVDVLTDLFIMRSVPAFIRSDNGPEFVAKAIQAWINAVGSKTTDIVPSSPWGNGYCESFNARLRDESLIAKTFYTLKEALIIILKGLSSVHRDSLSGHPASGIRAEEDCNGGNLFWCTVSP